MPPASVIVAALRRAGILDSLLHWQTLDTIDIEGVARVCSIHLARAGLLPSNECHIGDHEWRHSFVAAVRAWPAAAWVVEPQYDSPAWQVCLNSALAAEDASDSDVLASDEAAAVRCLARCLLAATGRDCSIMLSLQRCPSDVMSTAAEHPLDAHQGIVSHEQHRWRFSVGVVDTDPRLIDRLDHLLAVDWAVATCAAGEVDYFESVLRPYCLQHAPS
jgi:hypothetical protein